MALGRPCQKRVLSTRGRLLVHIITTLLRREFYRGAVVEKVCEYMAFKTYYDGVGSKEEIPVNEFMERIPPEFALEM